MKELQTVLKNHFAIEFADKHLLETAFTIRVMPMSTAS